LNKGDDAKMDEKTNPANHIEGRFWGSGCLCFALPMLRNCSRTLHTLSNRLCSPGLDQKLLRISALLAFGLPDGAVLRLVVLWHSQHYWMARSAESLNGVAVCEFGV
jgi:hypothetical protein